MVNRKNNATKIFTKYVSEHLFTFELRPFRVDSTGTSSSVARPQALYLRILLIFLSFFAKIGRILVTVLLAQSQGQSLLFMYTKFALMYQNSVKIHY